MKSKPILFIAIISLLACSLLLVRCNHIAKAETKEITDFLVVFDSNIRAGNTDSLLNYFEVNKNTTTVKNLIGLLTGKRKGNDTTFTPKIVLDVSHSDIKFINDKQASVTVPVVFYHGKLDNQASSLTLILEKIMPHQFKIRQVDTRKFLTDYIAYVNFIRSKTLTDADIYSPVTLKCFKIADELKAKYDSVIWFSHVKDQNYFYVVSGQWEDVQIEDRYRDSIKTYKMGLVGPDQKEIIPAQFDLIRSIGGTIENLVEVEKDHKRGFYDLAGKLVVPAIYDQIFPVDDSQALAVLRNGDDYYWLKNDLTISEKSALKIGDIVPKIKKAVPFTLSGTGEDNITEYNSREQHGSIYLPPSYLVDLKFVSDMETFANPLRRHVEYGDISKNYIVKADKPAEQDSGNWFTSAFYSIRNYFLEGRAEFYEQKNVIIVDKKHDRIYGADLSVDHSEDGLGSIQGDACDINDIKAINDTLFEVKTGSVLYVDLYDSLKTLVGGPYYHYLVVKGNKLGELPCNRTFSFTKYVKMNDSYLKGCYELQIGPWREKPTPKYIDYINTAEYLEYIKNEIYADYGYKFKDKRWNDVFEMMPAYYIGDNDKPKVINITDSLTEIDKYNIAFIDQKLKTLKPVNLAAK